MFNVYYMFSLIPQIQVHPFKGQPPAQSLQHAHVSNVRKYMV